MIPPFTVSAIREQFLADTAQMLSETVSSIQALLKSRPAKAEQYLAVIRRQGHSLRGLAGLVGADGLEAWGAGVEALAIAAGTTKNPAGRKLLLTCILDEVKVWEQMNQLSANEELEEAWQVYLRLHRRLPTAVRELIPAHRCEAAQETENRSLEAQGERILSAHGIDPGPAPGPGSILQSTRGILSDLPAATDGSSLAPTPVMPTLMAKTTAAAPSSVGSSPAVAAPIMPPLLAKAAPKTSAAADRTVVSVAAPIMPALLAKAVPAPVPVGLPGVDMELVAFFIEDAEDQLRSLERATLRWEQDDEPAAQRAAVRRAFHTLKGAANSVGLTKIGAEFHHAEDFIEGISEGTQQVSIPLFGFLLQAVDQLRSYTAQLTVGTAPAWPHDWAGQLASLALAQPLAVDLAAALTPAEEAAVETTTVRVDSARVSRLGSLLSEIVTDRRRVENRLDEVRAFTKSIKERAALLHLTVNHFQQQFEFNLINDTRTAAARPASSNLNNSAPNSDFSELEFDRYDEASLLARTLAELANDFDQLIGGWDQTLHEMEGDSAQFGRTSKEIQNAVCSLSLVSFGEVGPRLQRVFRDALAADSKEGRLDFTGTETLLDKGLTERIYPALLHLVRNAVAHGMETPQGRISANKELLGRVTLACSQVSNQIVLRITDDGAGLDEPAIRQRALAMGLLTDSETQLRPHQILRLVCHSGFSTSATVNDISGRGVGMDVVRTEIEALKGTLDLEFTPGAGTTWIIRLPLTLSITEGVVVRAGAATYALPMNTVLGSLMLADADASADESGRLHGIWQGESMPIIHLSRLLGTPAPAPTYGIVISTVDQKAILAVTHLIGRAELPMKPLDPVTACHPLLESASIDPQGTILPVLSVSALIHHGTGPAHTTRITSTARRAAARAALELDRRPSILIVDDSVSVRNVQTRLLESLGCDVTAAVDGLHALECLREGKFHMILTDLEMPRLNGYELIAEIRSNPAWSATPVIVISSRSTDKYVSKALNLGATSFLFKPFNEAQIRLLLDHHIQRTPAAATVAA